MIGWAQPRQVVKIVNWCGHSQEFVAWPEADGDWRLVPVLETATENKLQASALSAEFIEQQLEPLL
jgi:hypothetical protein